MNRELFIFGEVVNALSMRMMTIGWVKLFLVLWLTTDVTVIVAQESESQWADTSTFHKAMTFLQEGDTPNAIAMVVERLETDSLCPFFHLLNATIKLWDYGYFGDSAVRDVERYIFLRTHPELIRCSEEGELFQLWEQKMLSYAPSHVLGEKQLTIPAQHLIQGLNAYFKPELKDHCKHWHQAVEHDFQKVQILIDAYCP